MPPREEWEKGLRTYCVAAVEGEEQAVVQFQKLVLRSHSSEYAAKTLGLTYVRTRSVTGGFCKAIRGDFKFDQVPSWVQTALQSA